MKIEHVLSAHNVISTTLKGVGSAGVDRTPPAPVTEFTAETFPGYILLTWAEPSDSDYVRVRIQRKEGSMPTSIDDGETIHVGKDFFRDVRVMSEVTYFYRAFSGDAVGNYNNDASQAASAVGHLDETPPFTPYGVKLSMNAFNEYVLTGYTETEAAVFAEKGIYSWSNIADSEGYFIIVIPASDLKLGESLLVFAKDLSGNTSTDNPTILVTSGYDETPPIVQPGIAMIGNSATGYNISGVTEAGATVFITNFTHSWRVYADEEGFFIIYIQPDLVQVGEELSLLAIDAAGNQSPSVKVPVPENTDTVPPVFSGDVTITGDSVNGYSISGIVTEGDYTVNVYKVDGPTTPLFSKRFTDDTWRFVLTIDIGAVLIGDILRVTATDVSGNESKGVPLIIPADPIVVSPAVTKLKATGKEGFILLQWEVPAFARPVNVTIVRKLGGFPTSKIDGTQIYDQIGTGSISYEDHSTNTSGGVRYYYRFFTNSADGPVTDSELQMISAFTIYDGTPPETPEVKGITGIYQTGYVINGTAEPYAVIGATWFPLITDPYYVYTTANAEGKFELDCRTGYLRPGDMVQIYTQDRTGNQSDHTYVSIPTDAGFVAGDFAAPLNPTLVSITPENQKFTINLINSPERPATGLIMAVSTSLIRHPYDPKATIIYNDDFTNEIVWESEAIVHDAHHFFYAFPRDEYKNYRFPAGPFATGVGISVDFTPPKNVTVKSAVATEGAMTIELNVPTDADLAGILIVRKHVTVPESETDGLVFDIKKAAMSGSTYTFTDIDTFIPKELYSYRFFPYDVNMNINRNSIQNATISGYVEPMPDRATGINIVGNSNSGYTITGKATPNFDVFLMVGGFSRQSTANARGDFTIILEAGQLAIGTKASVRVKQPGGTAYSLPVGVTIPQDPVGMAIYKFKIDQDDSNPQTRLSFEGIATDITAGSSDWDSVFPFNAIRPVLFNKTTETVEIELNKNDFTKDINGKTIALSLNNDVMIEFPKVYWKIETIGNVVSVEIADYKVNEGFKAPAFTNAAGVEKEKLYISAYRGTRSASAPYQLSSHYGRTAESNLFSSSLKGYLDQSLPSKRYKMLGFMQWTLMQILFVFRYKSLNSLEAIGKGSSGSPTTGALKSGGMYVKGSPDSAIPNKFSGIENLFGISSGLWIGDLSTNGTFDYVFGGKTIGTTFADYSNGIISEVSGTADTGFLPMKNNAAYLSHYMGNLVIGANRDIQVSLTSGPDPLFAMNANIGSTTSAPTLFIYL